MPPRNVTEAMQEKVSVVMCVVMCKYVYVFHYNAGANPVKRVQMKTFDYLVPIEEMASQFGDKVVLLCNDVMK